MSNRRLATLLRVAVLLTAAAALVALLGCAPADQPIAAGECTPELAQYQWAKVREPFITVINAPGDPEQICGLGYKACVVPGNDGETAYLVLPPVAPLCLVEHERLHLLGFVHPM